MSLINADVKISTKALAKRIGKVLPGIIYKNETCILERNNSYNIHNLIDIIEYANTNDIQPAILFLDQGKAFDRANHDFLIKTLNHFTTDVRQPWTKPQDCYFEYLIIRFDYLIICFDYLIIG